MSYFESIIHYASSPDINTVYLGIGCAMSSELYKEFEYIENFQQYPVFLNHFKKEGHKQLIILFDPFLETPPRIKEYFELLENPLNNTDNNPVYSLYENEFITVFCINEYFYFKSYEDVDIINKTNQCISFLFELVNCCINYERKKYLFVQDFTGGLGYIDTFMDLFSVYDSKLLCDYVLFDVTNGDSCCYPNLKDVIIKQNPDRTLNQSKFSLLINLVDNEDYNNILRNRLNSLTDCLIWNYVKTKTNQRQMLANTYSIDFLIQIYKFTFDYNNKDEEYILTKYKELMMIVLDDIIESKKVDESIKDEIMSKIDTSDFPEIRKTIITLR